MRPDGRMAWFLAEFAILSLALGWVFWTSTSVQVSVSMLVVPVISVMLAAQGFPWKRKLLYAAATFALYLLGSGIADATGLMDLAARQLYTDAGFPSLWVVLYMTYLSTFPLIMLVLFAGRTPALLWTKNTDSRPPSRQNGSRPAPPGRTAAP